MYTKFIYLSPLQHEKRGILMSNKKVLNYEPKIEINGICIERVSKIKYLGIMINHNLNMNDQVKSCIKKSSSFKVNTLKRLSNNLKLKKLYTIVQPNFDYCSTLILKASNEQIAKNSKQRNENYFKM